MADLNGRTVGGFHILRTLKSGAQGTVYEAVCESEGSLGCAAGTHVAIKAMSVQDENGGSFDEVRRRTAKLSAIDHPNVVKYHGCFTLQDTFSEMHLVVMDYLEGETLKERLARETGGLDVDMAVRVAEGVVSGLAAASEQGVCHRDIKPGNIFLCRNGGVKLIDFELARIEGTGNSTSSGRPFGSFDYMAPDFTDQSFSGDVRSDVFSVGVVFHEMLSGMLPYRKDLMDGGSEKKADFAFLSRWARNPDGTFARHVIAVSSRIRRILAHVDGVFSGALNPSREGRFPDFSAFKEALGRVRFRDLRVEDRAYRLLRFIGKGGFGEVFKARLRSTGQYVAVKHLLNPDYADRFYREAKIMAQLRDPCFVRFIDFLVTGRSSNKDAFIVMAFLPGMPGNSLKDAIRRNPNGLPKADVLTAFVRYAHGLHVMHARGIYHRDIKPANLYYPDGKPGDSAIMDLGIARDVNGTVTTGSIPGTFDYMSPEVVVQQNRGGSGLDIYALGLCLYEALTGGTAYPRLPGGYAAYARFFKRAQTLEKPSFASPIVTEDRELLDLLRAMTEPDITMRITDAGVVEQRLHRLVKRGAEPLVTIPEEDSETSVSTAAETTVDVDDAILPTRSEPSSPAPVKKAPPAPKRPPIAARRRRPWVGIVFGLGLMAILAGVSFFAYPHVAPDIASQFREGYGKLVKWWEGIGNPAADAARAAAARVAAAREAADATIRLYESEATNGVGEGDVRRDAWKQKWQGAIPDEMFDQYSAMIDDSRQKRLVRDATRKERIKQIREMAREAKAVLDAYGANDLERGDRLRDGWEGRWQNQLPERVDHLTEIATARANAVSRVAEMETFGRAEQASQAIIDRYNDDGIDLADKMRVLWTGEWTQKLKPDGLAKLSTRMEEAREQCLARSRDKERGVREMLVRQECAELCAILEPVESRMNRLAEAMRELESARSEGVLSKAVFDQLSAEIRAQQKQVVFTVVNKSDRDVMVGTTALANGERRTFAFTNAVPDGFSVHCLGFEPIPLGASSNGRTIALTPELFVMERVEVTIPALDKEVTCRIDGAPVRSGAIKIMPGAHECLYMRNGHESQVIPFFVDVGRPTQLPPPGFWSPDSRR